MCVCITSTRGLYVVYSVCIIIYGVVSSECVPLSFLSYKIDRFVCEGEQKFRKSEVYSQ